LKQGEVVVRLRAKRQTRCRECGRPIYPGQTFLLDIIPYVEASGVFLRKVRHKHVLCEGCWKGPKNVIVDRTK
jgi:hypothetical protein